MKEEIEKKEEADFYINLSCFGIYNKGRVVASSRDEAYAKVAKMMIDGILHKPKKMPKEFREKLEYIADMVFENTGVNIEKIRSKYRGREIVDARHCFFWLANHLHPEVKPHFVGDFINRDRTVMYNSVSVVNDLIDQPYNKTFRWLKNIKKFEDYYATKE